MPKVQYDLPGEAAVSIPDVPAEAVQEPEYVLMKCPHDGQVYPCYAWTVEALTSQGWIVQR
jgi:hypothetical protein